MAPQETALVRTRSVATWASAVHIMAFAEQDARSQARTREVADHGEAGRHPSYWPGEVVRVRQAQAPELRLRREGRRRQVERHACNAILQGGTQE